MMYGLQKGSLLTEVFVKTADKNIVDRYIVQKSEIYLDKLQQQIDALQNQIDNVPKEIVGYPPLASDEVKKAIDSWNTSVYEASGLEDSKTALEDLQTKALVAETP